jgi:membrane protein DedA with SNARE-associated domain
VIDSLFHPGSYLGIFAFLVLTGCGLPVPEEVAIVLAGVLSAQGNLLAGPALAACLSGALLGDCIIYAVGRRWGPSLLVAHPRFARLLRADREAKFEEAIERHALKVLLLARFMVGIRGPVYLAAGAVRMPFRRFVVYDTLGVTMVAGSVFSLSYAYGDDVLGWIRNAELTITLAVLAAVAGIGIYLYRRHRQRTAQTLSARQPVKPFKASRKAV